VPLVSTRAKNYLGALRLGGRQTLPDAADLDLRNASDRKHRSVDRLCPRCHFEVETQDPATGASNSTYRPQVDLYGLLSADPYPSLVHGLAA
jgi:hypothetical protein